MKPLFRFFLLILLYCTCTFSDCSSGNSPYQVNYPAVTQGDIANTSKTVGVHVTAPEGYITTQIQFAYWEAGFNNGRPADVIAVNHNGDFTQTMPLPGSDHLASCQGMYYMFSLTYTTPSGSAGAFIGQPQLVMPTKSPGPNGSLEEALCAEPPGPEVSH